MTYFSALPLKQDQAEISNIPHVEEDKQQRFKVLGWVPRLHDKGTLAARKSWARMEGPSRSVPEEGGPALPPPAPAGLPAPGKALPAETWPLSGRFRLSAFRGPFGDLFQPTVFITGGASGASGERVVSDQVINFMSETPSLPAPGTCNS